jgi:hypothetical protein
METEFKVGDAVEAFGVRGLVSRIGSGDTLPVFVELETEDTDRFTKDGRAYSWHKEPSLKLIERPKRKVKKRFYMMAQVVCGEWRAKAEMVDENFKTIHGDEIGKGEERKILENSPYLELDCDATEGE